MISSTPDLANESLLKQVTFQQLRSFCETARLGSLKAAAEFLELAHPTVWQHVQTLERTLGTKLLERHRRGCQLTEEGRILSRLANHLVAGIDSLPRNFNEARSQVSRRLTVATTSRTLIEDLPDVVIAFDRASPQAQLCFLEVGTEDIVSLVESGAADLGIVCDSEPLTGNSRLEFELGYELDLKLVTPLDHPLARKRRFVLGDLCKYPWVSAPQCQPSAAVNAALDQLGVFQSQPRRIEAHYTATIRRYVELGFGIGMVVGLPFHKAPPQLHERSMAQHFGRIPVNLVWRKGALPMPMGDEFIKRVQSELNSQKPSRKQNAKATR